MRAVTNAFSCAATKAEEPSSPFKDSGDMSLGFSENVDLAVVKLNSGSVQSEEKGDGGGCFLLALSTNAAFTRETNYFRMVE